MVGTSKILTVSYGTFSCTLEGFDEPFSAMREIAEYFRDLAAEDRYFGAEPPTPDTEMLHRIAQAEVQKRVIAKVDDTGVVLTQEDAPPPAENRKQRRLREKAGVKAAVKARVMDDAEPAAPVPAESIAAKMNRIRAAVARSAAADSFVEDQHAGPVTGLRSIASAFADVTPAQAEPDEPVRDEAVFTEILPPEPVDADVVEPVAVTMAGAEADADEPPAEVVADAADTPDETVQARQADLQDDQPTVEPDTADIDAAEIDSAPAASESQAEPAGDAWSQPDEGDAAGAATADAVDAETEEVAEAEAIEEVASADTMGAGDEIESVTSADEAENAGEATPGTVVVDVEDVVAAGEIAAADVAMDLVVVDAADEDGADETADDPEAAEPAGIAAEDLSALFARLARGDEADVTAPAPQAAPPAPVAAPRLVRARIIKMKKSDFDQAVQPDGDVGDGEVEAGAEAADFIRNALGAGLSATEPAELEVVASVPVMSADNAETAAPAVEVEDIGSDPAGEATGAEVSQAEADPYEIWAEDAADAADVEDEAETASLGYDSEAGDFADEAEAAAEAEEEAEVEAEEEVEAEAADEADEEAAAEAEAEEEAEDEGEAAAEADAPVDEELAEAPAATVAPPVKAEALLLLADAVPADDADDDLNLFAGDDDSGSSLSEEDEAELMQELAEVEREVAETRRARDGKSVLAAHRSAESSVTRILRETESQLDDSEASRRRATIAHLKAAVAATRADRDQGEGEAAADDDLGAYRDDLDRVVRPRRPSDGRVQSKPRRLAPLMLVSEQRIDVPAGDGQGADIRPRRITAGNLALMDDVDDQVDYDEDTADDAEDEAGAERGFAEATSFPDYATRMGAVELADLIEAAAAYSAFVEGRPSFSRPALMKQVGDYSFSREDGLRAFGTLLRQGKILKLKRGQFAISKSSRFRPEKP